MAVYMYTNVEVQRNIGDECDKKRNQRFGVLFFVLGVTIISLGTVKQLIWNSAGYSPAIFFGLLLLLACVVRFISIRKHSAIIFHILNFMFSLLLCACSPFLSIWEFLQALTSFRSQDSKRITEGPFCFSILLCVLVLTYLFVMGVYACFVCGGKQTEKRLDRTVHILRHLQENENAFPIGLPPPVYREIDERISKFSSLKDV